MRKFFVLLAALLFTCSLKAQTTDYARYVDVFSGTKNMGHTFPGATVPFGMVQLSPETDTVRF
ncbi:MAG: hypothetical protein LWX07_11740, partial [Bacteroidetes bacterium]|nr:hypothetical protein [Bacteroidota bacterium]